MNAYETWTQASICARYDVCASVQTIDTTIVKEAGV